MGRGSAPRNGRWERRRQDLNLRGLAPTSFQDWRIGPLCHVGNTARSTAADPTGPEGNEQMRNRPVPDTYDDDLATDNQRRAGRSNDEITES